MRYVNVVVVAAGLEDPGTAKLCRQCVSPKHSHDTHNPLPHRDNTLSETV